MKEWREGAVISIKEIISNSIIYHDKLNDRIYLKEIQNEDINYVIETIETKALERKYTKIIGKVSSKVKSYFIQKGYSIEAVIPKLYYGKEDGIFLVKYLSKCREEKIDSEMINCVLNEAVKNKNIDKNIKLPQGFIYRKANEADSKEISQFYKKIFKTYPFPIFDADYIAKTMKDNVVYFTIWKYNQLAAISSSEIDYKNQNVEMTDFGTLPEYRGKGLAFYLLGRMERDMKELGIKTAYSIARAISYGMNITFAKRDYNFGGTLNNNTHISGRIESMNVWYKTL
jgi:beta-lysine N6-acetyltransferase